MSLLAKPPQDQIPDLLGVVLERPAVAQLGAPDAAGANVCDCEMDVSCCSPGVAA